MSFQASLCVYLYKYSIMDIVNVYLRCGLSVFDNENRAYVNISDGDDFDWEYLTVTFNELTDIISEKERGGTYVGILLYEDGEPVTDLLRFAPNRLMISCDVNRRTLDGSIRGQTDINWYVKKFISPLEAEGFAVEGFEYSELR